MKNDFCDLTQAEIRALDVPDTVLGFLLSPFQFNKQNGYVVVPEESFKEMIDLITEHAKNLHAQKQTLNAEKALSHDQAVAP